ncbi:MAG TPA: ABC transporter ATP-binding protein [Zeimonas sp.]|jgi:branched-chain amino acid transport system ATP-binding protein|nr:ABC transporter ATP-binding protein [Zeimonas sp.]
MPDFARPNAVSPRDEVLLRADNVSRSFGGLKAVDRVSLAVRRGTVHAVIGTNGAGKSTLINVLCGEIPASEGSVELLGRDVSRWSQPRRAQAGLGRSYQRNTIYAQFTVFENCRLSAQARLQRPWDWLSSAARCDFSGTAARRALEKAGLAAQADREAGALSHGQKRQLEIAMCLATAPRVLVLDEPLAGMGAEESERMLSLLEGLKSEHAILLVEHDMDAVFRVSDEITVMVNGRVIATGEPEAIRSNPEVQEAYLGDEAVH